MTVCMLLEAPRATTGALDPYGPPSIKLVFPDSLAHTHRHTQQRMMKRSRKTVSSATVSLQPHPQPPFTPSQHTSSSGSCDLKPLRPPSALWTRPGGLHAGMHNNRMEMGCKML